MFDNYIIEVHSQAAGIVVRDERGFRFFSAHHVFDALEGRIFKTPRHAEKVAAQHERTRRGRLPRPHTEAWSDGRRWAIA